MQATMTKETNSLVSEASKSATTLLLGHYYGLVDKAGDLLFKWWEVTFIGLPNTQNMPSWRSRAYAILSPSFAITNPSKNSFLSLVSVPFWAFILIFWARFIHSIALSTSSPVSDNSVSNESIGFLPLILLLLFVFVPICVIYVYTPWYLSTSRNAWKTKVAWCISLVIVLVVTWFIDIGGWVTKADLLAISNSTGFCLLLLLFVVPATLLSTFLLLYFFKLLTEISVNTLRSLFRAHHALPISTIHLLTTEIITSNGHNWKLSGLSIMEIKALKELAQFNLDATEKKTIPAGIILAFAGFLVTVPVTGAIIGRILDVFFTGVVSIFLPHQVDKLSSSGLIVNLLSGFLFMIVVITYLAIFRNLIIQGIIIQSCVVAEYEKEVIQDVSRNSQKNNWLSGLIKVLFSFIKT